MSTSSITNIVIVGALGRMGVEIAKVILEDGEARIAGCVEYAQHPKMGQNYGLAIGADCGDLPVCPTIEDTGVKEGVVIDFSSVPSTRTNLQMAGTLKLPMVVGTTGLEPVDHEFAQRAAGSVPVLVSSNMSLGVNLLFSLTEFVAKRLGGGGAFDIEIVEAHHRFKKDSPSGTARTLGEIAAAAIGLTYDDAIVNGRSGMAEGTRPPMEIGMHAVRGGDIVGDHTVLFAGIGERLELRHTAHNRGIFARGAVTAAKWIASKQPGLYTMKDVLGL